MTDDLATGRAQLQDLLIASERDALTRRIGLPTALLHARHLDEIGDIYDTRQLASVLTRVASAAAERGDNEATLLAAGELLAVLSDIADQGDEEMAIAINEVMPGLDRHVRSFGKAWVHRRRAGL